jgi:uncharacterized protein (DUF362 family)/NAD-dependent dihydropyrimidine dehydrogenase PreA subunit
VKVSIVRCPSYDREEVRRGVAEALAPFGGFTAFVGPGEKVLVKPNLLIATAPERAVTTHPEVVQAVVEGCQAAGAEVWVGDSPGFGSVAKVAARSGVLEVCRATGARLVPLEPAVDVPFPAGRWVKRFPLGEPVRQVEKVISVAKFKTHGLAFYTGAVKNLYGTVAGVEKAHFHLRYQSREEHAGLLVDLYHLIRPVLSLVDAVVGMEGAGPQNGSPRPVGLLLAGADGLAVDAVGASLMGLELGRFPLLQAAALVGERVDLDRVEVVGVPLAEARVPGFVLPETAQEGRAPFRSLFDLQRLPPGLRSWLRRQLTARPVVVPELCLGCGICRESCPAQAIAVNARRAAIADERCIRCYCCQEMCPQAAIALRHGPLARRVRRRS